MKPIALALTGGKILLFRSRGFGRNKRLEGQQQIAPKNFNDKITLQQKCFALLEN